MEQWNIESAAPVIYDFDHLAPDLQEHLLDFLNRHYPPEVYRRHRDRRRRAFEHAQHERVILDGAEQHYPPLIRAAGISGSPRDLHGCAVVLTAGGEGERLRTSLLERGVDPVRLENFTKATFPLPGFVEGFGALHVNLALIAHLSGKHAVSIPVIVTTGPEGSTTAAVIPEEIRAHDNFGIAALTTVSQDERLHLTVDERIAWKLIDGQPRPVTNPDETGGPLMRLKRPGPDGHSILDQLIAGGVTRIIVLQGTAVYHPELIPVMASAARGHDALGVGVLRTAFAPDDPYGSYVLVEKNNRPARLTIIEQKIRNEATLQLVDSSGMYHVPYNTGFYVFDTRLLQDNDLPDYATPPKEVLPGIPRTSKIGYAATDILPLARDPAVLAVDESMFGVIKNADDLQRLTDLARGFGLDSVCAPVRRSRVR